MRRNRSGERPEEVKTGRGGENEVGEAPWEEWWRAASGEVGWNEKAVDDTRPSPEKKRAQVGSQLALARGGKLRKARTTNKRRSKGAMREGVPAGRRVRPLSTTSALRVPSSCRQTEQNMTRLPCARAWNATALLSGEVRQTCAGARLTTPI